MNDVEIEIKVYIKDSEPLVDFLENNATFESEKHQVDEYFSPTHRDFLASRPTTEWLRLRDSAGSHSLNYKKYHFDQNGKPTHCDEYQTKVEDLSKVKKIFAALNFKSLVVVDKVRKSWLYQNYEISLDSVKGLGEFIEIEYLGQEEQPNPEKITSEMIRFLKNIGYDKLKIDYVGYPFLLLFPQGAKYEEL